MYETLEINNFRGIKNFKMGDFRQINLLVGKNNCGKTTILESLFLITGPTNPQLPIRINAFRNITLIDETYWSLIFNNLNINSEIKISAQVEANFEKENRTLCIKPSNKSRVSQAKSRDDKAIEGIEATNSSSGTMPLINGLTLSFTLARDDSDQMNIVSEIFQGMAPDGRFLNFEFNKDFKDSLSGVFINQTTTSSDELGVRFSKVQISKQVEKLVEVLNKLDQSIKSLALSSNRLIYCDIGLDSLLPINVMGDGIFRLLSILLAFSEAKNGVLLIDEIGAGLYYSSQKILWEAVFEAAKEYNVQVFATTHSLECVSAFSAVERSSPHIDNARLYRLEKRGDSLRSVPYNGEHLKISLDKGWEVR